MKHTGGGLFDPDQRHVYFAASNADLASRASCPPITLVACNDLLTSSRELDERLDVGQTVMVDSGIFALTMEHRRRTGITMDEALNLPPEHVHGFDRLRERYIDLVRRYEDRIWGYVELDQGGQANKRKTRAGLEALGLRPIPVYHPLNDGWDYFDELATQYDRICFGNLVWASTDLRARLAATMWERHRDYPNLWVHGLGLTPDELMHSWPFDSVDSTSWFNPVKWGSTANVITAGLDRVGALKEDYLYTPAHTAQRPQAVGVSTWIAVAWIEQWRTHRDEMADLGVSHMPARHESEAAPCPQA